MSQKKHFEQLDQFTKSVNVIYTLTNYGFGTLGTLGTLGTFCRRCVQKLALKFIYAFDLMKEQKSYYFLPDPILKRHRVFFHWYFVDSASQFQGKCGREYP